jgi:hypothetical protein
MIYRKAPPQPPKLLLRIVSAAGAGVLVGAAACGGVADSQIHGSVVQTPDDSGDSIGDENAWGASSGHGCNSGVCPPFPGATSGTGFVVGVTPNVPPDAGDASDVDVVGIDAGIRISPDAGDASVSDANDHDAPMVDATSDANGGCHVLGICIRPDASHTCLGVCIAPDQ